MVDDVLVDCLYMVILLISRVFFKGQQNDFAAIFIRQKKRDVSLVFKGKNRAPKNLTTSLLKKRKEKTPQLARPTRLEKTKINTKSSQKTGRR